MSKYLSCAETAKLLRESLKQRFPNIKFSVRSKTYSGGASITVEWTDGPSTESVKTVCNRFEGATFDGMIDLKSYHTSIVKGEEVRFGADFIFERRNYSAAFFTAITSHYCKRHGYQMPRITIGTGGEPYISHEEDRRLGNRWLKDELYSAAYQATCTDE